MKKVLVTGAAGAIGNLVLKYLLSEGKYEITALDLRNKNNMKILKKYRRRINIIYGDINDQILMDALVKDQDYIIHLAGVMPPLADIKKDLSEKIEYDGTANIIKSINFYNPECFLIYASSTTIYGDIKTITNKDKPCVLDIDYYSKTKLKTENLIKAKLKNYIIIRLPLVLTNPKNTFIYNVKKSRVIEAISENDAGYLFVSAIESSDKLKRKVWNAKGGITTSYREILVNILSIYGISLKYILVNLFIDKNYYSPIIDDNNKLNEILEYQSDSLESFLMRLKRNIKGRKIAKALSKPYIYLLKRKIK